MNKIINWVTGLGNLWNKLEDVGLWLVGAAAVLGGASKVLLEVAGIIAAHNITGLLGLVQGWQADPGVLAIMGGLAALKVHQHVENSKPQDAPVSAEAAQKTQ